MVSKDYPSYCITVVNEDVNVPFLCRGDSFSVGDE